MKNKIDKHKYNNHPSRDIILCDFDGTITQNDVTDEILNNYGNPRWIEIGKLYLKGKISHGKMNLCFAEMVKASPEEISNLIEKKIRFREGFSQIVDFAKEKRLRLLIVSSGWDFYIRRLLKQYNPVFIEHIDDLTEISNKYLPVISNTVEYDAKNYRWKLNLKWDYIKCTLSSPCKAKIALQLKKLGFKKVVVIGNSESDICMAEAADLAFSTGSLTNICNKKKITSKHFMNFGEIVKILKNWMPILQ